MKLTNNEIYNYANALNQYFGADNDMKLPIKVSFFLQKNIKVITEAAQEIDKARIEVAQRYGVLSEDGQSYQIPDEKIADASKELEDLFTIEQHLNIHMFKLDDFNNIELTSAQTAALLFMIKDEDSDGEASYIPHGEESAMN